ncbi:hypothetical protein NFX39_05675 [Fructobacillus sp. W13]|uniref:Uncharacterized protein n=1 Tax=Fructobacillus apis TaxID=2935017 RepID=A0ABT0ZRF5_9LACO|nr:hypothetical protein [Fructobacillus apis]MCO0832567.1 hypothetical protein [Fructobacillus apis]
MKTILNRVNWLFLLVSVMLILWADAMAYAESYILIMLGMNLLMMCFVPSGTGSALHQFNLAIDNVIIFLYVILAVAQYIIERNESKHS